MCGVPPGDRPGLTPDTTQNADRTSVCPLGTTVESVSSPSSRSGSDAVAPG